MIEIGRRKLAVCLSFCSLIAETTLVHFDADRLISVAERHSVEGTAVDLFNGEEIVIYRGIEDALFYGNMLEHVISHSKALVHQLEGREEDVLEELELAVVAVRHVAAEH